MRLQKSNFFRLQVLPAIFLMITAFPCAVCGVCLVRQFIHTIPHSGFLALRANKHNAAIILTLSWRIHSIRSLLGNRLLLGSGRLQVVMFVGRISFCMTWWWWWCVRYFNTSISRLRYFHSHNNNNYYNSVYGFWFYCPNGIILNSSMDFYVVDSSD